MDDLINFVPEQLRALALIAVAAYFAVPQVRRIWVEYRHRTHELARDRSKLEVVKLQFEIELLRQKLASGAGAGGRGATAPTWIPELDAVARGLSIFHDPVPAKTRISAGRRLAFGLLGAVPLGIISSIAAWENDPGPTAFAFTVWCGMGGAAGYFFGSQSRLLAFFAGLVGPVAFLSFVALLPDPPTPE